jgi:S-disulfanyl-L-cysteine oxidoreductase SoxD
MTMKRLAIISAFAALSIGATPPAPAPVSTLKGVYSEAQAEAGGALYAARCAMCHGKMLEGTFETPALQGRFIANWSKAPLNDLTAYLARAMPQFAPGTLTPDETAKITAYLLKANAQPAGANPLPADAAALKQIMLEPQPAVPKA